MTPKNFERHSDPTVNQNFSRPWTDPDTRHGLQHVGIPVDLILKRIERQRTRSAIAKLLQTAQAADGDEKVIVSAFLMAERCRQTLGVSWPDIVIGAGR